MKTGSRSNAMLVELLIVILFFMLGATLVMQVFEKAFSLSHMAGVEAKSLTQAQNIADHIMGQNDWAESFESLGFSRMDILPDGSIPDGWQEAQAGEDTEDADGRKDGWVQISGETVIQAFWSENKTQAGTLLDGVIRVLHGDEILIELPCAKYISGISSGQPEALAAE